MRVFLGFVLFAVALAASTSKLHRIHHRLRAGARAPNDADQWEKAAKASFIIGDCGSGGTRLFLYKIDQHGAVAPAVASGKPMAQEGACDPSEKTHLDQILDATTDEQRLVVATRIINYLYEQFLAAENVWDKADVLSVAAPKEHVQNRKILTEAPFLLDTQQKRIKFLARVPIYYEATAGLRIALINIEKKYAAPRGEAEPAPPQNLDDALWKFLKQADEAWVAMKSGDVDITKRSVSGTGDSNRWVARCIPGRIEGFYGFWTGAALYAASGATYLNQLYVEVGGASQQITFVDPSTADDPEIDIVGVDDDVRLEPSIVVTSEYVQEDDQDISQVDGNSYLPGRNSPMLNYWYDPEEDYSHYYDDYEDDDYGQDDDGQDDDGYDDYDEPSPRNRGRATNKATGKGRKGKFYMLETDARAHALAGDEGPMFIRSGSNQDEPVRYFSKSFLGNGLNRFTAQVMAKAVEKHKQISEMVHGDAEQQRLKKAEADKYGVGEDATIVTNPCMAGDAELAGTTQQDGSVIYRWVGAAYDNKPLKSDFPSPVLKAFFLNHDDRRVKGVVAAHDNEGLLNAKLRACGELVALVYAGNDENHPAIAYAGQMQTVRDALTHAARTPQAIKTHVTLSHNAFKANDDFNPSTAIGTAGNNKYDNVVARLLEYAKADMRRFPRSPNKAFYHNAPLVHSYFLHTLFSEHAFQIDTFCPKATCTYAGGDISWTLGAAGFYAEAGKKPKGVVEWGQDIYKTSAASEDNFFGLCQENDQNKCRLFKRYCTWANGECSKRGAE
jgi:hypothetical protein